MRIVRVEVEENDDVTFFFDGDHNEPYLVVEFTAGQKDHQILSGIESRIWEYNKHFGVLEQK
jgi:hypothetical protein